MNKPDKEFYSDDGVRIRYLDVNNNGNGSQNTVLLIHGLATSSKMWTDQWPFNTNIINPLVEDGFRVIAMDCRGHGLSAKPKKKDSYGLKMVHDHVLLLDHLGITEPVHVAGASMGAEIAIKLAVMHPQRIRSLCPAGSGWSAGTNWYERSYGSFVNPCTTTGLLCCLIRTCWYPCCCPCIMYYQQGEAPDMNAVMAVCVGIEDILKITEDELKTLEQYSIPVHGIAGEQDEELKYLERMKKVLPNNFTMTIIPGRDHDSTFTHPLWSAETVNFIKACSGLIGQDETLTHSDRKSVV